MDYMHDKRAEKDNDRCRGTEKNRKRTGKKRYGLRIVIIFTCVLCCTLFIKAAAAEMDGGSGIEFAAFNRLYEVENETVYTSEPSYENELVLINKYNPVPDGYEDDLVDIGDGEKLNYKAAQAYSDMMEAAEKDGMSMMLCSAYRSYDLQQRLYDDEVEKKLNYGYSYNEDDERASQSVTHPGQS